MSERVHEGLEGVVVSATRLSHVDGERGRLIVLGRHIEQLTQELDFEAACAQLWAASGYDAHHVPERLAEGRALAFASLPTLGDALLRRDSMDALRAGLAHLPDSSSPERIVAALAVYTAASFRLRSGLAPIEPDPALRHAPALLAMLG
jgi:citrate synthase